jgi:hypothetical protein
MVWREAFINFLQEFVANVSGNVAAVGRVKPYHISVSVSITFRFWWLGIVIEDIVKTALSQGFLIWGHSRLEGLLIRGYI